MRRLLPLPPGYDLHEVLVSHGWIQLAPFERQEGDTRFGHVMELDSGEVVHVQIAEREGELDVHVSVDLTETDIEELWAKLRWMLALDVDLSSFYEIALTEPKLEHVVSGRKGRLLRSPTLFEDLVKTILTTNTSWAGTKRMVQSLVTLYGATTSGANGNHAFPTPARLAAASVEDLRNVARLGYRAPYVHSVAEAIHSGEVDLEGLRVSSLPTPELRKAFLSLKGIGPYGAAHMLMIVSRYDFIPIDSWAMHLVSQEWHGGEPIGVSEVEAAFDRWGDWKGLAYWFWDWTDDSQSE